MKEGNNFGKLIPFIMREKGTRGHLIALTDERIKTQNKQGQKLLLDLWNHLLIC